MCGQGRRRREGGGVKLRDLETRIAVGISRFAGSPLFIYIHAVAFAGWLLLGQRLGDKNFWMLTMAVSLEAILLSAFILLAQNRLEQTIEEQAEEEEEEEREFDEDISEIQTDLDSLRDGMDALRKALGRVEKRLRNTPSAGDGGEPD